MYSLRFTLCLAILATSTFVLSAQQPTESQLKDRVKILESEVSALKKEVEQIKKLLKGGSAEIVQKGEPSTEGYKTTFTDVDIELTQVIRSGTQLKLVAFATNKRKDDAEFKVSWVETVDADGVTRKTEFKVDPLKLRKGIRTRFELVLRDIPATVKMFSAVDFGGKCDGNAKFADAFSPSLFILKDVSAPGK